MNSLILSTAARLLAPLLVVFSIVVLLRGHNEPGGGFIGGLIAAIALALIAKAGGLTRARRLVRVEPLAISALGLACAVASALWGAIAEGAVLAGVWPFYGDPTLGGALKPVGSILLFDTGVFLVVVGGVTGMLFTLEAAALAALSRHGSDRPRGRTGGERD
ncbi:MAG: MnhB domain-containing protein [Paracoccaceae bacterium]